MENAMTPEEELFAMVKEIGGVALAEGGLRPDGVRGSSSTP